ncbi:MAG: biotin--[acetyl-CoA-carboxylase] ligase [Gemmobacter sp.]
MLSEVDSTMQEGARIAPGLAGPEWILAGFQTGGRGRRGRPWVSPRGNFHASLVMRPAGPATQAALRSFVAALALAEALAELTGLPGSVSLKWPNDVLFNGGKIAGILLESVGQGGAVAHLVIGIGVNLIAAPAADEVEPGAVRPVSLLAETGIRVAPENLLTALAAGFARWEARFAAGGFAPVRAAWLAQAARLGEEITARTGPRTRRGVFEGIDEGGALILRTAAGREAIPAAEVFF